MFLPYGLHINPLTVIQCHSCNKVVRQFFVFFQIMLLHIVFYYLCVNLVVYIGAMERFCLAYIVIGIYRLNPSGNSQHSRKCACRGNGKKLRVSQTIFIHQFSGFLCSICQEERCRHDFIYIALWKSSLFLCQFCRSCNGCVCHGKADLVTHFHSILFSVSQTQLQKGVSQSHNAQTDLSPLLYAFPLLLQGMKRKALLQNLI